MNAPLFWVKQISDSLEELKEIPLWGFPSVFPLEELAQKIASELSLSHVSLSIANTQLRSAEDVLLGLGTNPLKVALELTPLVEPFYWLMGQEDVRKLNAAALSASNHIKGFTSSAFQEGFYHFLLLRVAQVIDEMGALGDLSVKLAVQRPWLAQESLCFDVAVHVSKHTLWGRIACSDAFRHAFKAHFSMMPVSLRDNPLAQEISLTLPAVVGKVKLLHSEWSKVKVGDFIALDQCSFDPITHKGGAELMLNSIPLLRVRLKAEGIKVIDYAYYHEEIMNENEHFSDEDEPSEAEPPEETGEGEHLWSPENEENPAEQIISSQEIQLSLMVEVARLKINLDKLLQLKPGNVLELPVRPEQGVDISIGGKKIAKAELIKLGDVLGVKILHLGD
ncbi:MAG TPA: type III secretion system cytoplasmic ring protein SctQ [Rhabdochlamydiaceae bacterium]|jgi:flagellar motor switch protein FliN/FliY